MGKSTRLSYIEFLKKLKITVQKISEKSLWGVDLGGTKIEGVILASSENPEVLFRDRVPTEADQGYEHILHQFKKLVDMMCGFAGKTQPADLSFEVVRDRDAAIRNL